MLVLLSPAKKTNELSTDLQFFSQPQFTKDSKKLITTLRKYKTKDLERLMKISTKISELNVMRYKEWEQDHSLDNAKQAALTFDGEAYTGLNVKSFSESDITYAQDHLRLLSGLYGLLKPFDLIHPYRLEMGTRITIGKHKNLYEFWGDKLVNEVNEIMDKNKANVLVNLASNEYFKSINTKKLKTEVITPVFKDFKNGEYKTIMVYAKRARGMMSAYIIKNRITEKDHLIGFDTDGYCYNEKMSTEKEMVFLRG